MREIFITSHEQNSYQASHIFYKRLEDAIEKAKIIYTLDSNKWYTALNVIGVCCHELDKAPYWYVHFGEEPQTSSFPGVIITRDVQEAREVFEKPIHEIKAFILDRWHYSHNLKHASWHYAIPEDMEDEFSVDGEVFQLLEPPYSDGYNRNFGIEEKDICENLGLNERAMLFRALCKAADNQKAYVYWCVIYGQDDERPSEPSTIDVGSQEPWTIGYLHKFKRYKFRISLFSEGSVEAKKLCDSLNFDAMKFGFQYAPLDSKEMQEICYAYFTKRLEQLKEDFPGVGTQIDFEVREEWHEHFKKTTDDLVKEFLNKPQ